KNDQRAAIFFYDEVKKEWVEVGGTVNGNQISVEVNHFKKYAVLAVSKSYEVKFNFSDTTGHWAESMIQQAVSEGIVNGYRDGTFKPNQTVTRAEFVVMLMNALGAQGEGTTLTFTDKSKIGAWAQTAVAQAVQAGLITGFADGSFHPDSEITRAEVAVMIGRVLR
ncbi:S-layer homology domain-containing protein, partial [Paenibacillus sinopodophylli]|uniref:S-layer homology domain-containing protein n=1 Tax=Paenibacillus sinopodophylli TaxID=1837342 RepID=UPI00110CF887